MGADLYIKNLDRDNQITGFRTNIDSGYFRDCYNSHGLLSLIHSNSKTRLSWNYILKKEEWLINNSDDGLELNLKGSIELKDMLTEIREELSNKPFIIRDGGEMGMIMSDIIKFILNEISEENGEDIKIVEGAPPEGFTTLTDDGIKDFFQHLDKFISFLQLAIQLESNVILSC